MRHALMRWLLFASLALGVVVMHHVMADAESVGAVHSTAVAPITGPPMDQHPAPDPGPKHDALHLCMAVIQQGGTAVIVLLLLIGVVALASMKRRPLRTGPMPAPARAPPGLAGRALLHSVCVARL